MKSYRKPIRFVLTFMTVLFLFSVTAFFSFAADDFEAQIASFPESYKAGLRELHKEYPEWKFQPFFTGLDWNTVIDNEHDDYALVEDEVTARIFKSLEADDYNAAGDYFYYKDGDFVAGSRLAVEYFMDPRNFFNKSGIFQFELLNFSSLYTVNAVEAVLSNSFMGNSKMTYKDASGNIHTDEMTYAQAIFNAGKTYNINPCFLASKILNEVGSNGSESVSGTNSRYPGIYNFYNIGASDGAGAVERGLLWASGNGIGSTTYHRPWNTPYKSIMGGALFLAEEYIAAGQFTGYLQRFNVNPDADYKLYTHEYMSNLSGALSQGHSTYLSYRNMGMLNREIIFSIPVYNNMSDVDADGRLIGAENTEQYATVTQGCTVYTGPSVDHSELLDSSGRTVFVAKGTEVKILAKYVTDAYYYPEILEEPFWYQISFSSSGKTLTGYVPAVRLNVASGVYVKTGVTDISLVRTDKIKNNIISSDPTMVKIIDGDTVNFLKKGKVTLYFYDSCGNFEEILFVVGDYGSYYPANLTLSVNENTVTASVNAHNKAIAYGFSISSSDGKFRKATFGADNTAILSGLKSGTAYTVFAQNQYSKYAYSKTVSQSFITKPQTVSNLKYVKSASGTAELFWTPVENATGYEVLSFNDKTGSFTRVTLVSFGNDRCTLSASQAAAENFVVRAYCKYGTLVSYGAESNLVSLSDKPSMPDGIKITSVKADGYTISWTGDEKSDGYEVFSCIEGQSSYTLIKDVTDTSVTITGLSHGDVRSYRIRAYKVTDGVRLYSVATKPVTGITLPVAVSSLRVTPGSGRAMLSWQTVAGASGYTVYYRKSGGELKSINVSSNNCELKNLDSYSLYYFAVSAFITREDTTVTGVRSATQSAKTMPSVPVNISLVSAGYNFVRLQWYDDSSLDAYKVYVLDSSDKLIGSKAAYSNTLTLGPLEVASKYKFIIRGYKLVDGKYIGSENSAPFVASTVLPVPEGIKSTGVTEKTFRLSWTKIPNAAGYNLYLEQSGSMKKVKTVTTNYCDVDFMPASTVGKFCVTALYKKGSEVLESKGSAKFTASTLPAAVSSVSAVATSNSVKLTWSEVNDAYCYRVYLYENGKFVLKKTLEENTCTLTGLKDCTTNYVAVRAYFKNTTGVLTGKHVTQKFYTRPLSVEKIVQSNRTDTSYTLTWSASSAPVNRYYVYRYNTSAKKYELLGSTSKTTCNIKNIKPGTTQRYAVIASVVKDGKAIVSSAFTYYYDCGTYLSKTENLRQTAATESAIRINWDSVEGATGYRVYVYDAKAESFKLLGTAHGTQATFTGLPSGAEYYFRVNAVKESYSSVVVGYYSSTLRAATK
ncbi:MAG: hypothetical protein E7544_02010 [Ruminococcaceae bacterium]|nr:hypothetical protein [Oscillospiraceae bacterium]